MNAAGMTITYHIDLDAPQNVVWIGTLLVQGDDSAHKIVAELYRGREKHNPANDVTALGVFVRSDGYAVALGGEIAGNTVTIALDGACYDVAGPCYLSIVLNDQGGERTVLKAAGRVDQDENNGYIDETVYTSFDALVEAAVNAYLGGSLPEGGGSGTITGPYVSTINGQSGDVTLDAAAVGALPDSTQIPRKTSELTNDSGYITKAVSDLTNYYLKSETYTREEINQRISQIPKFTISVVTALPASGDATTIYLVGGGISGDLYTEYIWADGAWEILGSQRVDLTGYATETWVTGQLSSYLQDSELAAAINTALAQAAASGEFDGEDGVGISGVSVTNSPDEYGYYYITIELTDGQTQVIPYKDGKDGTSVTVKSVSESTADGGSNVVTFSDGKTLNVKNGSKGSKGDTGSAGAEGAAGADGVGISTIKQTTTSTADGGTNVFTVTLTNGTSATFNVKNGSKGSTGATGSAGKTPVRGTDYWTQADQEAIVQQVIAALGTPVFGTVDEENNIILTGELPDGTYTLKYEDADGEVIEIGELSLIAYTNQIPISTDTDGSVYNGTGYLESARCSSSGGVTVITGAATPPFVTGFIPVKSGDVVRLKNCYLYASGDCSDESHGTGSWGMRSGLYNQSKTFLKAFSWGQLVDGATDVVSNYNVVDKKVTEFTVVTSGTAYMRLTLMSTGNTADAIVTVNEEIT